MYSFAKCYKSSTEYMYDTLNKMYQKSPSETHNASAVCKRRILGL